MKTRKENPFNVEMTKNDKGLHFKVTESKPQHADAPSATSVASHTPTPWKVSLLKGHDFYPLIAANGKTVASIVQPTHKYQPVPEGDANAAFIVRAVNAHEEMLTALKQAQATIHATWKSLGLAKDGDVARVFQTVSQAIAKAEAKP